ncbi:MAG: hypothetical protein AUI54_03790 [Acidobacteria bacterium 13_1_40CM_2_56_5]|nr:MAG: hypothetical protein AUI54_03790 [Acidobacteria bacterium 13_1_40CM_2_56_5]
MRSILYIVWFTAALIGSPQKEFPKDPLKEMQRRVEKEAGEKNYKELKDAATELAELSRQISADIDEGGQHVISARLYDRLDKIEKLTKRIREKARGTSAALPKIQ